MRFVITLLLSSFISLFCFSQSQKNGIYFENSSHDFGEVKEGDGPVSTTFEFKNYSSKPVVIVDVKASCGCTTPEWSKDPVQPNEKGFIKASFNPRNRPGTFNKVVTVKTNGTPDIIQLKLKGEVIPKEKGIDDEYPFNIGNLKFEKSHLAFGSVYNNQKEKITTKIYNQGNKPISIDIEKTKLPEYSSLEIDNKTINPKKTSTLTLNYDASKVDDWGFVFENFMLATDDSEEKSNSSNTDGEINPFKRINVSAHIKEDFSSLKEGSKRPSIVFNKTTHDFGKINQKSEVKTTFEIENKGNATLLIRKTKASCGCTVTKPEKTELKPGEKTTLNVTFSSGYKKGKQKKSITVICNDPANPETHLWIESDIQVGELVSKNLD